MPCTLTNCTDTNKCVPLRKGLSAIAMRRTGLISPKTNTSLYSVENTAAPKEISAAKCHSVSLLAL